MDISEEPPALRFLRAAKACRVRDLQQLSVLGALAASLSALVHALQKERGVSSIYLGSGGTCFVEEVRARACESLKLEEAVRDQLRHVEAKLEHGSTRFYARAALCCEALDSLAGTRADIAALHVTPRDAVKTLTTVIAALLAVGFEAADMAADPATSRALVALVHFAQGKEYAGQERAIAAAGFSRGSFDAADRERLQRLAAAQERAFGIFTEFASADQRGAYRRSCERADWSELHRLRAEAQRERTVASEDAAPMWYEVATRRIDELRGIEDTLARDLALLCATKLAEARSRPAGGTAADREWLTTPLSVAMLVADVDPGANRSGIEGGLSLYGLDGEMPKTMRSILAVIGEQTRRIELMSTELESARSALAERKLIEQAKGLLMRSHKLSEQDAYTLLRQTAMNRNKRIFEVAAALVNMAELLPP